MSAGLYRNGWKETSFDTSRGMCVYENPDWPGSRVLIGGGFAITGPLHGFAGATELGSGGDYELLFKFLDRVSKRRKS